MQSVAVDTIIEVNSSADLLESSTYRFYDSMITIMILLCRSIVNSTPDSSQCFYPTQRYVIAFLYWFIFVAGGLSNFFVLTVAAWKCITASRKPSMFVFICSLAVSDLGQLLGVTSVKAILVVQGKSIFPQQLCPLFIVWRSLTIYCCVWVLTAIAFDRWGPIGPEVECVCTQRIHRQLAFDQGITQSSCVSYRPTMMLIRE